MNAQNIRAQAWQLRSGVLRLEGDRVEIIESMMQTKANRSARATVQARADAINKHISDNGLHFESMDALQKHFRILEAQA